MRTGQQADHPRQTCSAVGGWLCARWAVLVVLAASGVWPAGTFASDVTNYEWLADWNALPNSKAGVVAGLASTYDRSGWNSDWNHYESPTGLIETDTPTVIATLSGPGMITRFWMPHGTADEAFPVKLTVDGVLQVNTTSNVFLGSGYSYIQSPLVKTMIGGQVCYEPIAFQNSLVIESHNYDTGGWARTHHYHQYNYLLLVQGSRVVAYDGTLNPAQQAARAQVVGMLQNVGAHPAGASGTSTTLSTGPSTIPADGALTLCDLEGSGRIRRISLQMSGASGAELDGLRLQVRYDSQVEPAIDVPVAHFFGAGHERVVYRSLPLGTDSPNGFYCYWPMPFHRRMVVSLFNSNTGAIGISSAEIEYEWTSLACDVRYLHAKFAEEMTVSGQQYHPIFTATGSGHYVGNLLYLERAGTSKGILEGDEIISVDGSHVLYGTGLEDAYNGGYYYNHVLLRDTPDDPPWPENGVAPYYGLLNMNDPDQPGSTDTSVRTDQYRWLIGDCVPFSQSIDVKIENWGKYANVLFGSTAFYYLRTFFTVGDFDGDSDADTTDFAHYQQCVTGPGVVQGNSVCQDADLDGDGDVDLTDYGVFQRCYSGEGNAVAVDCARDRLYGQ